MSLLILINYRFKIVRRINISISAMPGSCPCVEFSFTDCLVFVLCQFKLSASGKMAPCDNVKIDWGLNAVRIQFANTCGLISY